jgi:hypothetical protein
LSISLLTELRNASGRGVCIAGFIQSLVNQLKEYHLTVAIQWQTYVQHIKKNPPESLTQEELALMPDDFVEFGSDEYDQNIPSCAWLAIRLDNIRETEKVTNNSQEGAIDFAAVRDDTNTKRRQTHLARCRRCGKCYGLPEWQPYHEYWSYKMSHQGKVWEFCTVDEDDFEEGFPHLELDKKMPRKSRSKKKNLPVGTTYECYMNT